MKKLAVSAIVALVAVAANVRAESVTLKLDGVKCDQCAEEIIGAIEKVPSAKLKEKPSQKKPLAVLEIDLAKADVGAVAKAVAAAETPHKSEEAPGAYLVLSAPGLTAANAKKVGDALKGVKGVTPALTLADAKKKEITVRLKDDGDAKLADITKALAEYTKK
jgi:copper chaperone CopZ